MLLSKNQSKYVAICAIEKDHPDRPSIEKFLIKRLERDLQTNSFMARFKWFIGEDIDNVNVLIDLMENSYSFIKKEKNPMFLVKYDFHPQVGKIVYVIKRRSLLSLLLE